MSEDSYKACTSAMAHYKAYAQALWPELSKWVHYKAAQALWPELSEWVHYKAYALALCPELSEWVLKLQAL